MAISLLAGCGSSTSSKSTWEQFFTEGTQLLAAGDVPRARRQFEGALEVALPFGPRDLRVGLTYDRLARTYAQEGDSKHAADNFRSAIKYYDNLATLGNGTASGDSSVLLVKELIRSLSGLGTILIKSNQVKGAEEALTRVRTIVKSKTDLIHGDDKILSENVIASLTELAKLYAKTNRSSESIAIFREAKELNKKLRAPGDVVNGLEVAQHPKSNVPSKIAPTSDGKQQQTNAERAYARKLAQFMPQFEKFQNSGEAAYQRGDFVEATKLFREATSYAAAFGETDDHSIAARRWLLKSLIQRKEWSEARKLVDESGSLTSKTPISKEFDNLLNEIARVYKHEKSWRELEELLKVQLTLREKLRGENHYHVGETLAALGSAYLNDKKFYDAKVTLTRALTLISQRDAEESPKVQRIKAQLQKIEFEGNR